jgi:arabinan endo-1,5-alpha-L-arabinosidase
MLRARSLWAIGVLALAASTLTGCSGAAQPTSPSQSSAPKAGETFVIDQDFPDPDVLASGGTYYAYATNTASVNIQLATSKNFSTWTVSPGDALPELPSWAEKGNTWAPDVSEPMAGHFVMYFVAREPVSGKQCIGMATATSATGPFASTETKPMICPVDEGGAIDPSTFVGTDGTRYLLWKNDGNCCGLDTWLRIAPLSADGASLGGPATKLVKQTEQWEGNLVEAPTLVKHDGVYALFYSANDYGGDAYAIGVATAANIRGPYTKAAQPFLSSSGSKGLYTGPGGQDVVAGPKGKDYLVFHSWDPAIIYRGMNVLPLTWADGKPSVSP